MSLTSLSGLSMFAFYEQKGCDPVRSGQISNANQVIRFVLLFAKYKCVHTFRKIR